MKRAFLLSVGLSTLLLGVEIELKSGWNLIGTTDRVDLANSTGECVQTIWKFKNSEDRGWKSMRTLESEEISENGGFWVRADGDCLLKTSTIESSSKSNILKFKEGWNLLGTSESKVFSNIDEHYTPLAWKYSSKEWIKFDTTKSDTFITDANEGFWIKASRDSGVKFSLIDESSFRGKLIIDGDIWSNALVTLDYQEAVGKSDAEGNFVIENFQTQDECIYLTALKDGYESFKADVSSDMSEGIKLCDSNQRTQRVFQGSILQAPVIEFEKKFCKDGEVEISGITYEPSYGDSQNILFVVDRSASTNAWRDTEYNFDGAESILDAEIKATQLLYENLMDENFKGLSFDGDIGFIKFSRYFTKEDEKEIQYESNISFEQIEEDFYKSEKFDGRSDYVVKFEDSTDNIELIEFIEDGEVSNSYQIDGIGGTDTASAIQMAREEFKSIDGVKTIILLTDGIPTLPYGSAHIPEIEDLDYLIKYQVPNANRENISIFPLILENSDYQSEDISNYEIEKKSISLEGVTQAIADIPVETYSNFDSLKNAIESINLVKVKNFEIRKDSLDGELIDLELKPDGRFYVKLSANSLDTLVVISKSGDLSSQESIEYISCENTNYFPSSEDESVTLDLKEREFISGELMDNIDFGVDGAGAIESIKVDGELYNEINISHPIQTLKAGEFEFNFSSGEYNYTIDSNFVNSNFNESFEIKALDSNGDATTFNLNIDILAIDDEIENPPVARSCEFVCNYYDLDDKIKKLPDFSKISPVGTFKAFEFNVSRESEGGSGNYQIGFDGYGYSVDYSLLDDSNSEYSRYEYYGLSCSGKFSTESEIDYSFNLTSDDGSKLYIDGVKLTSKKLDGLQNIGSETVDITLESGEHIITIDYFQGPKNHIDLILKCGEDANSLELCNLQTICEIKSQLNSKDDDNSSLEDENSTDLIDSTEIYLNKSINGDEFNNKKDTEFKIEAQYNGDRTFSYNVSKIAGQDLSHWGIITGCKGDKLASYSPISGYEEGIDGSISAEVVDGIKWNSEGGEFTIILANDNFRVGNIEGVVKSSTGYGKGLIIGPICD